MIEQSGLALPCVAQFTTSGSGATGLSVTVNVYKWNGSTWSTLVSGGSATEVGDGCYSYQLASGSNTGEGVYLFVFITTGTADLKKIPAGWVVNKAGVEFLDVAITSRLAPTVASRTLDVNAGGEAGLDFDNTSGTLAKGTDITGFNDLSAAQVNAEADTALADVGLTSTITGRIDAAVSTRLASSGYTAPDNASIASILSAVTPEVADILTAILAVKAKTDQMIFTLTNRLDAHIASIANDAVTAAALAADASVEVAAAVLDVAASSHNTAGSIGQKINAAGSASDPLTNDVPGNYDLGTAGYALGQIALGEVPIVVQSNVSVDEEGRLHLTIVRDDDCVFAQNEIRVSQAGWPDLTSATEIRMIAKRNAPLGRDTLWFSVTDVAGERVTGSGIQTVVFRPTRTDGTSNIIEGKASGEFTFKQTGAPGASSFVVGFIDGIENQRQ